MQSDWSIAHLNTFTIRAIMNGPNLDKQTKI